jgi:hypothetical protein
MLYLLCMSVGEPVCCSEVRRSAMALAQREHPDGIRVYISTAANRGPKLTITNPSSVTRQIHNRII